VHLAEMEVDGRLDDRTDSIGGQRKTRRGRRGHAVDHEAGGDDGWRCS
jgi:hypothetical protein